MVGANDRSLEGSSVKTRAASCSSPPAPAVPSSSCRPTTARSARRFSGRTRTSRPGSATLPSAMASSMASTMKSSPASIYPMASAAGAKGAYGYGQILLVDDLLLVQAHDGNVVLLEASPERCHEFTRFSAIRGKTWTPPVLVGHLLLVRNGAEAACYELP